MKKKWIALLLASAMALGTGIIMTGCNDSNTEPEHKTHYDVNADGKCDKCDVDMEGHKHIYSVLWDKDDNYHWHKATCAHDSEQGSKAEHEFKGGVCKVCSALEKGLYHFEAEDAILDDGAAPGNATMVIEVGKHEFTESGKQNGALVSNVGYFGGGAQGQTITWKFNAASAVQNVKLTLRLASSVGEWGDKKITEIDLNAEGAPTVAFNGAAVSLEGKKLPGLENLTQDDMQNGVAYHNFCDVEIMVDLKAGENVVVLTSGSLGCNVDKIMLKTDVNLTFDKTDNTNRPGSH